MKTHKIKASLKTKILSIVVIFLASAGCTTLPDDLRHNDARKNVFIVNYPYDNVYVRLNEQMSKCFQYHVMGVTSVVQNQINPVRREATVTLVGLTTVQITNVVIDIRAVSDDKTEVSVYTRLDYQSSQNLRNRIVKEWAENASKECP